jgi:hypothetical protein
MTDAQSTHIVWRRWPDMTVEPCKMARRGDRCTPDSEVGSVEKLVACALDKRRVVVVERESDDRRLLLGVVSAVKRRLELGASDRR